MKPAVAAVPASRGARATPSEWRRRLLIMQSNGGLMSDPPCRPAGADARSRPGGGVVIAYALRAESGLATAMTGDMGGTSAKASMIEDGEIARAPEYASAAES